MPAVARRMKPMMKSIELLRLACLSLVALEVTAFVGVLPTTPQQKSSLIALHASSKLSDLPQGISPFERSMSKNMDVQGDFRKRAAAAIQAATRNGIQLQEVEFPPLIGGSKSKSQFDDFDNVQELNQNRDWCIQLLPMLQKEQIWFILPDLKECELAKQEWTGARYRDAAVWTTIEAVTNHYSSESYSKPWGATIASTFNKALAGDKEDAGLLGDGNALDDLTGNTPSMHLICQPGNGGPVEDWINCELVHTKCDNPNVVSVIVNGALDKVRDGYYPGVFFPKLAATVNRFYKNFESVFFLKPISDKGLYGWLYRVYPEPWQVVLQTVKTKGNDRKYVENTVVYTSDQRPSFALAVEKLVAGAAQMAN